ncbi:hypothetical protein [Mycobacterium sp. PSTR-4-N]|uniref:hypothetical protein n=1 Tax=Mycobacterium sp. PSTR-4-N TaxID=2917745 RepID=UPI001F14ABC5|nr:hypothetical protein [Mycobacterium sp. PSTR-4-N]MCG7592427.1 hypothetical protein [Mycobacterium sp. PSTR-4-N]
MRRYTGREPVVTIWRNQIPHRAILMYWGIRLRRGTHGSPWHRLLKTRPRHIWTIHSPVLGGETLTIDTRGVEARWHNFQIFDEDGSRMVICGPAI